MAAAQRRAVGKTDAMDAVRIARSVGAVDTSRPLRITLAWTDAAGSVGSILARVNVEIVKRSDQAKSFVVLPKGWIVERTLAWLCRCRRLAKDWECLNRKALAFLRLASIRLMLRKLCNPP